MYIEPLAAREPDDTSRHLRADIEKEQESKKQKPAVPHFSDPEKAREAAYKSAEVRREKARKRAEAEELARLSVRQRFALALQERTDLIPGVVESVLREAANGKTQAIHALVRLLDQAFGTPEPAKPDAEDPETRPWAELNREQRALLYHRLIQEIAEQEAELSGDSEDEETWEP